MIILLTIYCVDTIITIDNKTERKQTKEERDEEEREMRGPWNISSIPMGPGEKMFGVYRLKDIKATDHSGNREELPELFKTREEAEKRALELNQGCDLTY